MFKCVVLIAVALAAPATASSIGKAMSGEPDHAFQSGKNLFEIERCIVMADMPDAPSVYRSPDKPNESLIFYPKLMGKGQPVIKLESVGSAVSAKVWHPNGKGMSQNVASCM